VSSYKIAGGLVDQVEMTVEKFVAHGDALLRAQPIRVLRIEPGGESI